MAKPEWICLRWLASSSRSRMGMCCGRYPGALAGADGIGGRRTDWRGPA
jgi:hypothetical protein